MLLLILLILGVLALFGEAVWHVRLRAGFPVHLGWLGLFLIFLADLIRAWPK